MIAQRILAVLSAILLVGAVALATLGPPSVPLGQVLFMIDHDLMESLHRLIGGGIAGWAWSDVIVPLMLRPAWLIPASAGILCGGAALSLTGRKPAVRSRRRS